MRNLIVAKTKDFPFWCLLEEGLTYDKNNDNNYITLGKWEKLYANKEELFSANREAITSVAKENNCDIYEAISICISDDHLQIGDDGAIYERTSGQFRYCVLGGIEDLPKITQYKNVIKKTSVDAFVTADFDVHYTGDEPCPFEDDDVVYVIDGHN